MFPFVCSMSFKFTFPLYLMIYYVSLTARVTKDAHIILDDELGNAYHFVTIECVYSPSCYSDDENRWYMHWYWLCSRALDIRMHAFTIHIRMIPAYRWNVVHGGFKYIRALQVYILSICICDSLLLEYISHKIKEIAKRNTTDKRKKSKRQTHNSGSIYQIRYIYMTDSEILKNRKKTKT